MAKVMLVEDDNNLREIYEARLLAEGYEIVSAKDGEEALVVAKAEKPDLIISDVMMPKISGFEMLDILRNTEGLKDVRVIMLTALGQSDDQQRADRLGADRYLVKSQVTLEDIVKVSHELLGDAGDSGGTTTTPPPADPGPPTTPSPAPPTVTPPSEPSSPSDNTTAAASPAPAAPAGTVPAATPAATIPVIAAPPADSTAASDDKLMADAVDKLLASTEAENTPAATAAEPATAPPVTEPQPAPASPGPQPATVSLAVPPAPDVAAQEEVSNQVPVNHKKVIKPLDNTNKKDLNALLAEEEAKEAGSAPAAQPTAVTADAEKNSVAAAQNDGLQTADDAPLTTAQEEASVEAKIEDFVAGATTEATAPLTIGDTPLPDLATAAAANPPSEPTPAPAADNTAGNTTTAANPAPEQSKIGKATSATAPAATTTTGDSPSGAAPTAPDSSTPTAPAASAITGQAPGTMAAATVTSEAAAPALGDPNSIAL